MFKYKVVFLLAFLFTATVSHAQVEELEGYDYVIVPSQFGFQKSAGEHDLNSFMVFLFRKYGFNAYLNTAETPGSMNVNGCNTLYADVETSGFLTFKTQINLKDCKGKIVFQLPEGRSRIKDYKRGYQDAFRDSFEKLEELDLGFTYSNEIITMADIKSDEIEETEEKVVKVTETKIDNKAGAPKEVVVSSTPKPTVVEVVEDKAAESVEMKSTTFVSADGSYRLEPTANGFNVIEAGNKIGTALKTSGGVYLITTSEFSGVGRVEGKNFVIEREVKGVEGLVKMTFNPSN